MAQIEIDEILNTIKSENALNNEILAKATEEINSKLEDILDDGVTTEHIKSSLQELEVTLESRYRNNLENLGIIKNALESLSENQELLVKNSDLKIMFNILNENIDNFAHEIDEQKKLIDEVEIKLDEFRNDNSKKDEIIEKVAIVKDGIDEVNRGLQASIMDVNSSLRGINKTLMTMDVTDQNDIIKRELENIYISTTAILSSLEIADQKNDDLAKNILVKDDLINLAGKIDNSFALVSEKIEANDKSEEILSEIHKNREELINFNENVSKGLSDYLNSVRDVLANCIDEIRQAQLDSAFESDSVARQKFENLEKLSDDIKKIDTSISNQSESYISLINGKIRELGESIDDFKSYIDKSNTGIGDKLDSKIGALDDFVVNFKDVFENKFGLLQEKVDNSIQFIESFASDSTIKLGNSVSEIVDIKGEISRILENMTAFNSHQEANVNRIDTKLNGDLVDLKNDLNNFCGSFEVLKYTIEQSNLDNREILTEIVEKASDNTKAILENLKNNTDNGEKNISAQIEALKSQVTELTNIFTSVSAKNIENILSNLETHLTKINSMDESIKGAIESKLGIVKELVTETGNDTKNEILNIGERLSKEVSEKVQNILSTANQNFESIISNINVLNEKKLESEGNIQSAVENAMQTMQGEITQSIAESKNCINDLETKLVSKSEQNVSNIIAGIETVSDRINNFGTEISTELINNAQTIKEVLQEADANRQQKLDEINERFITIAEQNSGNILSGLESTSSKIDMLGVDLATEIDNNFDMVRDFIESSKKDKNQSIVEFETLSDNIKNLESEFSSNVQLLKSALEEQLNGIKDYLDSIKNQSDNEVNRDDYEKLAEKMLAVETALHDAGDNYSDDLMMLQNKISDYIKSIETISSDTTEKLKLSLDEISDMKSEVLSIIQSISNIKTDENEQVKNLSDTLIPKFNEILVNIADIKESVDGQIGTSIQKSVAVIDEKFANLQELLNESNLRSFDGINDLSDNISNKIDTLRQEVGLINTDVSEIINSKTDSIVNEFTPLKESIDTFLNNDFDKIIDSIKSQIELSYLSFSADVNDNMTENHDNYVHLEESYKTLIERFTKVEEIVEDLTKNQLGIVTSTISEVEKNFANNLEKTNAILDSWKDDVKLIEDKITQSAENVQNNVISQITAFIKTASSANKKEIKEFIANLIESNNSSAEISSELLNLKDNLTSLHNKVDVLAMSDTTETIEYLINSIQEKIDILVTDDKDEKIKEMVQALHDKVDVMVLSDNDSKLDYMREILEFLEQKIEGFPISDISKIQETIQILHDKVDLIFTDDNNEKITDLIETLHEKIDVLVTDDNNEKIENMVQALHDKVDVIAQTDESEIITEIQDIKDLIYEQRKQIETFSDTERSVNIDKCLKELLSDISNIEDKLVGLDLEKNASDIKDSVMNAVLSVADQITFVEETEEIKGFVEERTDEINKNLLDVKKQLNNITNGSDEWDYSYTMQDIESDIAKLRIILNDISASTSKDGINEISQNMHKIASSINSLHSSLTEEQILELKNTIEKINDDVLSLSSRTNKLLLTSDESYKALTDGLDEFSRITTQLQSRIDSLDNNEYNEVIERKLDNINNAIASSANSNNVIRQVMMYLGEWIDQASEKLDTIAEDTSNVSIINSEICLLKSMVDNTAIVESLEKKFEEQQKKIDMLENKLNEFLNVIESQNNLNLEKKLDKLNDKISKLSQGIEKLASYVDEE